VLQLDVIVYGDRAVEQDDDARDEISGDLLQAETEADAECTAENGKRRQIDPHYLQQQEEDHDEDRDLEQLGDDLARADIERRLVADDPLPGRIRNAAEPEQDDAEEQRPSDRVGGKPYVADV